jgi:hypothetical protein
MRRRPSRLFLAAVGTALATDAAAGTKLVSSWRDPSAGLLRFEKVLVLCVAPYESQSQFAEAELVRLMKRTRGVAAHTVMSPGEAKDGEKMRAVMAREGFDGALTMRFVDTAQQITERAGGYVPAHTGFWDNYSGGFAVIYDPGYVKMDRAMQMETQVYSMKDGKLVWSGLSQTMNPKSAQQLVDDVARTVAGALRKARLIE